LIVGAASWAGVPLRGFQVSLGLFWRRFLGRVLAGSIHDHDGNGESDDQQTAA